MVIEYAAVEFTAGAMRRGVVDGRIVVNMLLAADNVETIQRGCAVRTVEAGGNVVARQGCAQRKRVRGKGAAFGLKGFDRSYMKGV